MTPGPWKWFDYPNGGRLLAAPSRAVLYCPDASHGCDPADANLIAKAPELLSALKQEVELCSACQDAPQHIAAVALIADIEGAA